MFDTITLKTNVMIHPDYLQPYESIANKYIKTTGEYHATYKIKDKRIPSITYYEPSGNLHLQVSIPKFLYGDNVTLISESDITRFFDQLSERLYALFGVHIGPYCWTVRDRIDVCWNFPVGNQVSEYIRQLSMKKLPHKNTVPYNHTESVYFKNKSSEILFYDKEKQSRRVKESSDIIQRAKGILRLEIRPSDADMRKYTHDKQAVKLLTKDFFEKITSHALKMIPKLESAANISLQWLMVNRNQLYEIEKMLGFQVIQSGMDETTLRELYPSSTYANRIKLAKKIHIPCSKALDKLSIDYSNLG